MITGGLGFVGHALSLALLNAGFFVRVSSRRAHSPEPCGVEFFRVADDGLTNWRNGLKSVNTVVHCAARVHVKDEIASDPLVAFRTVNVSSTLELARQAANMGIKRFVFVSSIGVDKRVDKCVDKSVMVCLYEPDMLSERLHLIGFIL